MPSFPQGVKSVKRDLVLTQHGLVLVGRENKANSNKKKGGTNNAVEIITKKISLGELEQIALSTRQDDFVVIVVRDSHDLLLQV